MVRLCLDGKYDGRQRSDRQKSKLCTQCESVGNGDFVEFQLVFEMVDEFKHIGLSIGVGIDRGKLS